MCLFSTNYIKNQCRYINRNNILIVFFCNNNTILHIIFINIISSRFPSSTYLCRQSVSKDRKSSSSKNSLRPIEKPNHLSDKFHQFSFELLLSDLKQRKFSVCNHTRNSHFKLLLNCV